MTLTIFSFSPLEAKPTVVAATGKSISLVQCTYRTLSKSVAVVSSVSLYSVFTGRIAKFPSWLLPF